MSIHGIFRQVDFRVETGRCFLRSLLLVLPLILAVSLMISGCQKEEKAGPPPPPVVEVAEVVQKDVPIFAEWVGTLDGFVNATIRAQVQGYLIKQNYQEGDLVRKGQVLFEIDPREFQAALDQAKAGASQAKGALDQAKAGLNQAKGAVEQTKSSLEKAKAEVNVQDARWTTAKANLARIKPLAEQNAVSKKDLDDAAGMELSSRSAVDAAKAAVDAAQANIVAAEAQVLGAQANIVAAEAQVLASQAAVEKADLNLGFTKITSLIEGIAGIAKAQIGNLVGPGSVEELTTVSTIHPIKCYVSVSEQEYLRMEGSMGKRVDKIPLELILADGSVYPKKGEFAFADRQVDVRTGTIRVATLFPNPQNILRPGQFSRVRAEMGIKKGALAIPQRAVTEVQGKYLAAVVGPENKVAIRQVKAGARFGQLWVVEEGLKAGEKVVAEGTQKVRDGMTVNPKPFAPGDRSASGGAQKPEEKPEGKPQPKPGKR
jgi:membrane fusion protein (multidrug efflux system)